MAKDDNEHRMLFDLRGRRRNAIKIVYAVLAILMGASLFLTVGPFSIAEIFNDGGTAGNPAEPYEEQSERLEAKLRKDPDNPDLLMALTRAQINTGNNLVSIEDNRERVMTLGSVQAYQQAYDTWTKYLKATDEPAPGLAQLVAPAMLSLAETSRSLQEARRNITAAAEVQELAAELRPTINAYSTLAYYTYFTGDFAAAEAARKKAEKLAKSKAEVEAVAQQLDEFRKRAKQFDKEVKRSEQQAKAGAGAGGGEAAPEEPLEEGENPLGGALGGGGLGE
ncbi:MAG TPA: hypothetical protein VN179_02190 [Solirubrobacterales bacterium]|nr:hypothetical protein [Solirubrobacterales bacterium]